jgi:hypothetical protein
MLADQRPELLVLEGFINDAEEQNEYLRIILVIHRKFAPKKNGLNLWISAGKSQDRKYGKDGTCEKDIPRSCDTEAFPHTLLGNYKISLLKVDADTYTRMNSQWQLIFTPL